MHSIFDFLIVVFGVLNVLGSLAIVIENDIYDYLHFKDHLWWHYPFSLPALIIGWIIIASVFTIKTIIKAAKTLT